MLNILYETYDSLKNIEANNKIIEAMATVTDDIGEIAELKPTNTVINVVDGVDVISHVPRPKEESNIYDVYSGTFNILKLLHAKKYLECNYVKGATEADDTIVYDTIVRYNKTNSTTAKTVLSSINVTSFFSIKSANRAAAVTGKLANSDTIEVDWEKLSALTDPSAYITKHNKFNDDIRTSIHASKPFSS
jgi:hypothetical protein